MADKHISRFLRLELHIKTTKFMGQAHFLFLPVWSLKCLNGHETVWLFRHTENVIDQRSRGRMTVLHSLPYKDLTHVPPCYDSNS